MLIIKNLNGSFLGNIVKSDNTIRNSLTLKNSNPTDFGSVITVSTTTSFCVNTFDVNNSQSVSWNNTTLIKMESKLFFSFSLVHEILVDVVTVVNDSVGFIFNCLLFILAKTLVVSDIQMSLINGFLSTILPHMRAKHFSASSKYDVSTSMMSS